MQNFRVSIFILITVFTTSLASAQCSGCSDYQGQSGLSSSARKDLAKQFAPQLRFDRNARTYPMSAKTIFDNSNGTSCNVNSKLNALHGDAHFDADFSQARNGIRTYYTVTRSGNRYFIAYWWTYWRQPNCSFGSGGHDYDWEHVVVQAERQGNTYRGVSVTFYQHRGWYTKLYRSDKMSLTSGHPVVYVGKVGHGSYHKGGRCAVNECCYFGDCRNSDSNHRYNVWSSGQIWEIKCNTAWFSYPGQWGGNRGPLYRETNYQNLAGCKGNANTCISGDNQQGCKYSNVNSGTNLQNIAVPSGRPALEEFETPVEEALIEEIESVEGCDCGVIYPNPVRSVLTIRDNEGASFNRIIDIEGKEILQIQPEVKEIDVKALPAGLYFLIREDGESIRFIKE